jgi:hypothetical protein
MAILIRVNWFFLQVVFTDLNKEDVSGGEGRIWLVCNVVGDGNYQETTKCSCFFTVLHAFQCGSRFSI